MGNRASRRDGPVFFLAGGAARRPRLVIAIAVVLGLAAGALALRLHPSAAAHVRVRLKPRLQGHAAVLSELRRRAKQQQDLVLLQRQAKFDRLGVNDALMQFESDMDHRLLPEPERLLPVLDQIAADSHFVEIARSRARALAERIRTSREN